MATPLILSSSFTRTATGTGSIAMPSGLAAGDVLLYIMQSNSTPIGNSAMPDGFTALTPQSSSVRGSVRVGFRTVSTQWLSKGPLNLAGFVPASGSTIVTLLRLDKSTVDVNLLQSNDTSVTIVSGSGTTAQAPAITPKHNSTLLLNAILYWSDTSAVSVSLVPGGTAQVNYMVADAANTTGRYIGSQTLTATSANAATPVKSYTLSTTANWLGFSIALNGTPVTIPTSSPGRQRRYFDTATTMAAIDSAATLGTLWTATDGIEAAYGASEPLNFGVPAETVLGTRQWTQVTMADALLRPAVKAVVDALAKYPPDFVKRMGLTDVYFVKNIVPTGGGTGNIAGFALGTSLYLDIQDYASASSPMEHTFHHELAHIFKNRYIGELTNSPFEDAWTSLNPIAYMGDAWNEPFNSDLNGSRALSGSGTLTMSGVGSGAPVASVTLSGSGSLTATGKKAMTGAVALAGSGTQTRTVAPSASRPTLPPSGPVPAKYETELFSSGSGDIADDPAIWVNPSNPAQSVVLGSKKADSGGGIAVYNLDGTEHAFQSVGAINNVDLRADAFGDGRVLVVGSNRTNNTLTFLWLNTTTRTLSPAGSVALGFEPYGCCFYKSPTSGKLYAFVSEATPNATASGQLDQYELTVSSSTVSGTKVRDMSTGNQSEGMVADDARRLLFLAQEDAGLYVYNAEPTGGTSRTTIGTVGDGHLVDDVEGLSIAYDRLNSALGYLIVSSQGNNTFQVYDLAAPHAWRKSFTVTAGGTADSATMTDGVAITWQDLGPQFPNGLLVVHDGGGPDNPTNFKFVDAGLVLGEWGTTGAVVTPPLLIKHGQDNPLVSHMTSSPSTYAALPFDGWVVQGGITADSLFSTTATTTTSSHVALPDASLLGPAVHNFYRFVWVGSPWPWTNDAFWTQTAANLKQFAQTIKASGKPWKGIYFDVEWYGTGNPFNYGTSTTNWTYSATEGALPGMQPAAAKALVRQRGQQVMNALREGWPEVMLWSTYGTWLSDPATFTYLPANGVAINDFMWANELAGHFVEGMWSVAYGTAARLLDGAEVYSPRTQTEFNTLAGWVSSGTADTGAVIPAADVSKYKANVRAMLPVYDKDESASYALHSTSTLQSMITNAMLGSHQYAWLYTETHEWANTGSGKPAVPTAYKTAVADGRAAAQGGTQVVGGMQVFTSSGTFTPPEGITSVDVLVVGGGGAGGIGGSGCGGGGAGGVVYQTGVAVSGAVTVTVGAGGTDAGLGGDGVGGSGGNSSFGSITAIGGGGGADSGTTAGLAGGSGGGGAGSSAAQSNGGAGTSGQGSAGGRGFMHATADNRAGGGGGGAGGVGGNGSSGVAGNGGAGVNYGTTFGTSVGDGGWFASGGGGGKRTSTGTMGSASAGGGGAGAGDGVAEDGMANTGGGGGGAGDTGTAGQAGSGGSGVVIVKWGTAPQQAGPPVPGEWEVAFSDDFAGTSLDESKWQPYWYVDGSEMNKVGTYERNVAVSNGELRLTLESSSAGALVHTDFTGGYRFPVGSYVEARIWFPGNTDGSEAYNWPAWWVSATASDGWPSSGEHDIAEVLNVSGQGKVTVNYHSPSGAHNQGAVPGNWASGWHTFGLHRKASSADVYYDGQLVKTYPTDDTGAAEILILNHGKHDSIAPVFGEVLRVDYVRAWAPVGDNNYTDGSGGDETDGSTAPAWPTGFVRNYARASYIEDIAETQAWLFTSSKQGYLAEMLASDPILAAKVELLQNFIYSKSGGTMDAAYFGHIHSSAAVTLARTGSGTLAVSGTAWFPVRATLNRTGSGALTLDARELVNHNYRRLDLDGGGSLRVVGVRTDENNTVFLTPGDSGLFVSGKAPILYVVREPVAPAFAENTLWLNKDTGVLHTWDGATWVAHTDLYALMLAREWNIRALAASEADFLAGGAQANADRALVYARDTKAAADAAYSLYVQRESELETARSAATKVIMSASGKARVFTSLDSPLDPYRPGDVDGEIWWRRNSVGTIIGQWEWRDGEWQSRPVGSEQIANLDVGKLTATNAAIDTVVAQRIAAAAGEFLSIKAGQIDVNALFADASTFGKINTQHFAVGAVNPRALQLGMDELLPNPSWADPVIRAAYKVSPAQAAGGVSYVQNAIPGTLVGLNTLLKWAPPSDPRPVSFYVTPQGASGIPVSPGDKFAMEMQVYRDSAEFWLGFVMLFRDAAGQPIQPNGLRVVWASPSEVNGTWRLKQTIATAPDYAVTAEAYLINGLTSGTWTGNWYVGKTSLRRVLASTAPTGEGIEISPQGIYQWDDAGNTRLRIGFKGETNVFSGTVRAEVPGKVATLGPELGNLVGDSGAGSFPALVFGHDDYTGTGAPGLYFWKTTAGVSQIKLQGPGDMNVGGLGGVTLRDDGATILDTSGGLAQLRMNDAGVMLRQRIVDDLSYDSFLFMAPDGWVTLEGGAGNIARNRARLYFNINGSVVLHPQDSGTIANLPFLAMDSLGGWRLGRDGNDNAIVYGNADGFWQIGAGGTNTRAKAWGSTTGGWHIGGPNHFINTAGAFASALLIKSSAHIELQAETRIFGTTSVTGSFSATTKNFVIQHPLDESRNLVHGSTESPAHGVEYWGSGVIEGSATEVAMPDYFEALALPENRVVFVSGPGVWADPIEDGKFFVHGEEGTRFTWLVKAVRETFDVEPVRDAQMRAQTKRMATPGHKSDPPELNQIESRSAPPRRDPKEKVV